jgi:hypothetical protein
MQMWIEIGKRWLFRGTVGPVATTVFALCLSAQSQVPPASAGLSKIYSSTSSPAYIDASVFYGTLSGQSHDVCVDINLALQSLMVNYQYNFNGNVTVVQEAIIDARGIPATTLTCAASPWATAPPTSSSYSWPPAATILLPAAQITISGSWVLPATSKIVGQGSSVTVLTAASSGFQGSDMIDMGAAVYPANSSTLWCGGNYDCQSVVVQHVALNGNSTPQHSNTLNGIVNNFSEELSYVDDVVMTNMGGVGLGLGASYTSGNSNNTSANSGPYTKISYQGSGTCLSILGSYSGTRGVHGLTCSGSSATGPAILVDGANNTLQDIQITGYADGILIGSRGPAVGNVLTNISGSVSGSGKGLVHISSSQTHNTVGTSGAQSTCPVYPTTSTAIDNVCNLTVFGVGTGGAGTAIQDDLTATAITDPTVAMYALGEQIPYGVGSNGSGGSLLGRSRLTTSAPLSTNSVTWYTGSTVPATSCAVGSLYSCVGSATQCTPSGGTFPLTLFVCAGNSDWVAIK